MGVDQWNHSTRTPSRSIIIFSLPSSAHKEEHSTHNTQIQGGLVPGVLNSSQTAEDLVLTNASVRKQSGHEALGLKTKTGYPSPDRGNDGGPLLEDI